MERLTFDGNFCDIEQCKETRGGSFCECGTCNQREVWERLKAYEDTGLTPAELPRAAELMEADRGNKVMLLPYPIHEKLYRVTYPYRQAPKVTEYVVKGFRTCGRKHRLQLEVAVNGVPGTSYMYPKDFFETREEAEAALGGGNEI